MIIRASLFAGTAVALGAFGAHALRPTLEAADRLDDWHTAVFYQMVHALGLLAVGLWVRLDRNAARSRSLRAAGILWTAGILCFSGSLYTLGLGVPARWIWPVTPLGGLCFLVGWGALVFAALRSPRGDGSQA